MPVERATTGVWEGRFCLIWLEISHFFNIKTKEWDLKSLFFNYWNDLFLGSVETYFWKSVHTCLWKEPLQVSERFVFAEFDWTYHIFWNVKTEEWDLKGLLFNHWNDLFLGSVKTYFLEIGAYVSVKRATTGVSEGRFCLIWLEIWHFLNIKTEEWDQNILLFNYWNDLF